ncbi:MAG: hypothetical protein ACLQSW_01380, partial [Syntrophobacteraceae bacterium]
IEQFTNVKPFSYRKARIRRARIGIKAVFSGQPISAHRQLPGASWPVAVRTAAATPPLPPLEGQPRRPRPPHKGKRARAGVIRMGALRLITDFLEHFSTGRC